MAVRYGTVRMYGMKVLYASTVASLEF